MQNAKLKKTCVVLPAYNEEKNIANVIQAMPKDGIGIIVVDDGSTDNTYQLARQNSTFVIKHLKKMGKGAALKDGLNKAVKDNYDYIIIMDADGQHDPKEIPLFINEAEKNDNAGVIIGNRLSNPKGMPLVRFYTNKLMSYITSSLCKQNIPDTQCGFKLIKKDVLKNIAIKTHKFEIESELLIKAARANFKIVSIPIATIYAQEKSNINPFADTVRFVKFIIKIIFGK